MMAPVALFVYNRARHTKMTIDALLANHGSGDTELIIFSDGARTATDEPLVTEVRDYLSSVKGFKSVTIHESNTNQGLAKSIIAGITRVLQEKERIIVLEDDMVTSKYFLSFMNDALEKYEPAEDVISVHAYMYPVKGKLPDYFFLRGAHCWGWGTWRRGWMLFESDSRKLLDRIHEVRAQREFDYDNAYPFTRMLLDQINGLNNSWAIRWHASAYLNNKLTLYPRRSFVRNIGFDGTGVHSIKRDKVYDVVVRDDYAGLPDIEIQESSDSRRQLSRFFHSIKPGIFERVRNKIIRTFK